MDSSPLISVIVAIYNVEKYLKACLNSLALQTCERIEFILVNDGSSDDSAEICGEFARKDSRFKLISQENRGLSAARNTGIKYAKGRYLGFVDGDDWVDSAMYLSLFTAIEQYKADIAACQFQYVYDDGRIKIEPSHFFCVPGEEAVRLLLQGEAIQDHVCNKLFAAELFEEIRYPEGHVFEDVSTTYRLFLKAKCVVSIPEANYYYVQRDTGIVRSGSLKNEIDCYFAKYRRYMELSGQFPESVPQMIADVGHAAVKVWSLTWRAGQDVRTQYEEALGEISAFVRENYANIQTHCRMGITGRLILCLVRINKSGSYILCGLLHRIYQIKCRIQIQI